MRSLKVVDADFAARDMSGDRQDRHTTAVAVEQAIDEMQVARPATPGADRQFAREMRLRSCGEGCSFLMAHMDPVDRFEPAQRVRQRVQAVPDHAVDAPYPRLLQGRGDQVGG